MKASRQREPARDLHGELLAPRAAVSATQRRARQSAQPAGNPRAGSAGQSGGPVIFTPRMKSRLGAFIGSALLAVSLASCKQGEGEVCQIDDDCESGLECNAGTMRCQSPGADRADASPRVDAGPPDAGTPDAGFDAGVDASTT